MFLRAALTDSFYSSGMCVGRLMSIWLATVLLPSSLLVICMLSCLVGTVLLIFLAPLYSTSLYTGVAIMGFFVSWQFGTGFSWTSQHMNITGKISSIFFIGCFFNNHIFVKTQRNSTQLNATLKQLALELDIVVTCSATNPAHPTHPTHPPHHKLFSHF